MDNEQSNGGQEGGVTYYVSLSREYNGRVKISASAHYTAPADEEPDTSAGKLAMAVATSMTVAGFAQASIERILNDCTNNDEGVALFLQLVNESASAIAQRIGGAS